MPQELLVKNCRNLKAVLSPREIFFQDGMNLHLKCSAQPPLEAGLLQPSCMKRSGEPFFHKAWRMFVLNLLSPPRHHGTISVTWSDSQKTLPKHTKTPRIVFHTSILLYPPAAAQQKTCPRMKFLLLSFQTGKTWF